MAKTKESFEKRLSDIKDKVRYRGHMSVFDKLYLFNYYRSHTVAEFTEYATSKVRRLKAER